MNIQETPHGWMQRDLKKDKKRDYIEPSENSAVVPLDDLGILLRKNPLLRDDTKEKEQHMMAKKSLKNIISRKKSKPPKSWFKNMLRIVMKNNPKYTEEQAQAATGNIWYNKLKPHKKTEIKKSEIINTVIAKISKKENLDSFFQNIIGHLSFLDTWYRSCHWISQGETYYADHQLFQRLYGVLGNEIDQLGEKGIILSSEQAVDRLSIINYVLEKEKEVSSMSDLSMFDISIKLEEDLLNLIESNLSKVSSGAQNLFEGIMDVHETHLYLLNQRKN